MIDPAEYRTVVIELDGEQLELFVPNYARSISMSLVQEAIRFSDEQDTMFGIDELFSVISDPRQRRELLRHLREAADDVLDAFVREGYEKVDAPYSLTRAYEMLRIDLAEAIRIPPEGGSPGRALYERDWHSSQIGDLDVADPDAETYGNPTDLLRFRLGRRRVTMTDALARSLGYVDKILANHCAALDVVGARAHRDDLPMDVARSAIDEGFSELFTAAEPGARWRSGVQSPLFDPESLVDSLLDPGASPVAEWGWAC